MAEHVWSVLCEKLLRDEESNVVSLVSVLERVNIHETLEELDRQLEGVTGFFYRMRLVTWCVRSDYSKPESFGLRVIWHPPGGDTISTKEHQIELENTGARMQIVLQGVPWRGPGLYWLAVEIKNEGREWEVATRLPLEVHVQPEMESGSLENES